jgi:O-antigen/teichoic acid export membrane protein
MSINHRRLSITVAAGLLLEAINKVSPLLILHHAQKTLGLTDFGIAQYQLTMLESVQPFVVFGFTNYALSEPGVKSDNARETSGIFSHLLLLKILNALLVSVFIIFFLGLATPEHPERYSLGLLLLVLVACVADSIWYCIARHKLARVNFYSGILRLTSLGLILYFVQSAADSRLFVLLCILPNVLLSIYTGVITYKDLQLTQVAIAGLKNIVVRSLPFALILLFITVLERMDIFMVERWFGFEGAGVYAGPARVTQSLTLLISALAVPFYAETLKVTSKDSLYKHISLSLWFFSVLVAPAIFGIPFIETSVLRILFTDLPATASSLLSITAVGMTGSLLISVFGLQVLIAKGKPWPVVYGAALGICLAAALAWGIKATFALKAAAVGIVIGKLTMGLFCAIAARPFLPNIPVASFMKPMLAGAGMALALTMLKSESMVLNMAVGGVSYACLLTAICLRELKEASQHPKIRAFLPWK